METEQLIEDPIAVGVFEGLAGDLRVTGVGEDGDVLVVEGHHDHATAAAILSRHAEGLLGWDEPIEPDEIEDRWARFTVHTECDWWCDYSFREATPGAIPVMVVDRS